MHKILYTFGLLIYGSRKLVQLNNTNGTNRSAPNQPAAETVTAGRDMMINRLKLITFYVIEAT